MARRRAVANTVVSLYPYLRVAAPTILDPSAPVPRLPTGPALAAATLLTEVLRVAIGIDAEPLIMLAERAVGITGG